MRVYIPTMREIIEDYRIRAGVPRDKAAKRIRAMRERLLVPRRIGRAAMVIGGEVRYLVRCAGCGDHFYPRRSDTLTCSARCRQRFCRSKCDTNKRPRLGDCTAGRGLTFGREQTADLGLAEILPAGRTPHGAHGACRARSVQRPRAVSTVGGRGRVRRRQASAKPLSVAGKR